MHDKLLVAREYVRDHFPEMADVEPVTSEPAPGVTIFSFKKTLETADGAKLPQVLRVTVGADGQVLKAITSK